jgi:sugar phosphate isomerase/epimerase
MPHLQMRRQLEEAAAERGASMEDGTSLATADDAIAAMIRIGYERIASGELTITGHELIAVMRLRAQLDANATATADAQLWQAAFTELVEIAKRHLGPKWSDFVKEVYASEAIAAVSGYQVAPAAVAQGPVSA